MPGQKSVTKSFTLNPERDSAIIDCLNRPGVNASAVIRAALENFINGDQEVITILKEIRGLIVSNGLSVNQAKTQYNDPFLDQGL